MKVKDCKKQLIKLIKKIIQERMLVVRVGILTFIFIMELELIFVVKKLLYLKAQKETKVNQDLSTQSTKIADDVYEVALRLTITVTDGEETIYLIEVQQAGLFTIKGLEPQQLTHVINTTCPTMLFPYAREVIDNTLTKGSFPALMLPPINFEALFASAMQQAEAKAAEEAKSEDTTH